MLLPLKLQLLPHPSRGLLSALVTTYLFYGVCVCVLLYLKEADDHEDEAVRADTPGENFV